jgi:hypothetical protein
MRMSIRPRITTETLETNESGDFSRAGRLAVKQVITEDRNSGEFLSRHALDQGKARMQHRVAKMTVADVMQVLESLWD